VHVLKWVFYVLEKRVVKTNELQMIKILSILFISFCLQITCAFAQDNRQISLAFEYYNLGERDKAFEIFERLAQSQENIPFIHDKYLELLLANNREEQAEKYLNTQVKLQPNNFMIWIDLGTFYTRQGKEIETNELFADLVEKVKEDPNQTRFVATYLYNANFSTWAIDTYLKVRNYQENPLLFSLDLATLYRLTNQKEKMIEEYFKFLESSPNNINLVKDQLQSALTEEDDLPDFRVWLIKKVQLEPNNPQIQEMLVWVNVQMRDFNQAFVQARAYDQRFPEDNSKIYETGLIAYQNRDFKQAERFFQYFVDAFPERQNYLMSRLYLMRAKEEQVRSTYPVPQAQLQSLMDDYNLLIKQIGYNNISFEAMINKSALHAQYLNQLDSAVYFLNLVINDQRASGGIVAKAKLQLGDVFVLQEQPWESALLYAQVEKARKNESMGFEAKLRNARLSYYRGDFELAKGHLDVLKEATSREIANDALELSRRIKDNMDADSTYEALNIYARADLHYFMNRKEEALQRLEEITLRFPNHPLEDDVRELRARIFVENGQFEQALQELNVIIEEFGTEVLADDALFQKGKIYEEQLGEPSKAMEVYQLLLKEYPASFYGEEARLRFRKLRGDRNLSS